MELCSFGPPMTSQWEENKTIKEKTRPCPDRMNFTVVSYPKESPWPTQWNKRQDGSWEKKEESAKDKKKHEKMTPPLPFDNIDVGKLNEPKEDISYLRYFEAVLAYYKELRNDEKEKEKWLR